MNMSYLDGGELVVSSQTYPWKRPSRPLAVDHRTSAESTISALTVLGQKLRRISQIHFQKRNFESGRPLPIRVRIEHVTSSFARRRFSCAVTTRVHPWRGRARCGRRTLLASHPQRSTIIKARRALARSGNHRQLATPSPSTPVIQVLARSHVRINARLFAILRVFLDRQPGHDMPPSHPIPLGAFATRNWIRPRTLRLRSTGTATEPSRARSERRIRITRSPAHWLDLSRYA